MKTRSDSRQVTFSSDSSANSDLSINPNPSTSTLDALRLGVAYEVEDWLKLELTAEQMLASEASLLKAYLTEDAEQAKGFWRELQDDLMLMELSLGAWLLSAADPSSLEWQRAQWWQERDDLQH